MGQDPGQERAQQLTADGEPKTAAELRGEIEEVRRELGDTAAELAAKTDVKARASDKAEELKQRARENPAPIAAAAGAFVLTLLASRLVSRRRTGT